MSSGVSVIDFDPCKRPRSEPFGDLGNLETSWERFTGSAARSESRLIEVDFDGIRARLAEAQTLLDQGLVGEARGIQASVQSELSSASSTLGSFLAGGEAYRDVPGGLSDQIDTLAADDTFFLEFFAPDTEGYARSARNAFEEGRNLFAAGDSSQTDRASREA